MVDGSNIVSLTTRVSSSVAQQLLKHARLTGNPREPSFLQAITRTARQLPIPCEALPLELYGAATTTARVFSTIDPPRRFHTWKASLYADPRPVTSYAAWVVHPLRARPMSSPSSSACNSTHLRLHEASEVAVRPTDAQADFVYLTARLHQWDAPNSS